VFARGNAKQAVFLDDEDRRRFLRLLGESVSRFDWILTAYVLMSNHFHLVVQLTTETLSRGMHWLNGRYAQYFNERHERVGHVFQGRFKAPLVEKQTYAMEVMRYVVLNPVRAGLVSVPEEYRWSSHRAVVGETPAPGWLAVDDVLAQFARDREVARARYRAYVDAGIGLERTPLDDLFGCYLGSEEWRDEIRGRVMLKPRADEHPARQRVVTTPSISQVIRAVATTLSIDEPNVRAGRVPRMVAAWVASNEALLTHREIAAGLRLRSVGHISNLVRECERRLDADTSLRAVVDAVCSTMCGKKQESKT
jgi:REP element-mobilizing transposase RayT